MMQRARSAVGLALLALLAGCGQELVAGGEKGTVDATVVDDAGGSGASPSGSRIRMSRSAGSTFVAELAAPQGTVQVEGSVEIMRDDGASVPIASGSTQVRIASSDSSSLGRRQVDAGSYTRARITFTRVEANVTAGLVVGGVQISGRVRVPIAQPLVVDAPVQLQVRAGGEHRVVIDLNAGEWLLLANPLDRTVAAASFRSAVRVRVR